MSVKLYQADNEKVLLKQETTMGEFVTPSFHFPVKSVTVGSTVEQQELAQIEGKVWAPNIQIPGKIKVGGNISGYATPSLLGVIFSSFFGNSIDVIEGDKVAHYFDYLNTIVPSYTLQTTNSGTSKKASGLKCNTFALSLDNSAYTVSSEFVGMKSIDSGYRIVAIAMSKHMNFSSEVNFEVGNFIDIYVVTGGLVAAAEVEAISPDKKTVSIVTPNPAITAGMSIGLSVVASTTIVERPVQFYRGTNINVDSQPLLVQNLTLNGTNNINVDEFFVSGQNYAQGLDGKKRSMSGEMTIPAENIGRFRDANATGTAIPMDFVLTNIDGDSVTFNGTILISTLTDELTTGSSNWGKVGFKVSEILTLTIKDENSNYVF